MLYWVERFMKILPNFDEIFVTFRQNFAKISGFRKERVDLSEGGAGAELRLVAQRRLPPVRLRRGRAFHLCPAAGRHITLSAARSRLDQRRFSRPNTHFSAFFKIYKKIIFSRANLANFYKKKCNLLQSF